jgi:uncharacterized membrane protein YeiB
MNENRTNQRLDLLDYLRGFALLGIILVNSVSLLAVSPPEADTMDASYFRFLYLFVEGRFYTIFTFLFGVGFYLFITRAFARGRNGIVLFLRRITLLFLIGLVHVRFHPGEALTIYAVAGLFLLPFYKAHKWVNLGFGLVMLLVFSFYSSKIFMVVPLMLLGVAAGQFQLFERGSLHWKKAAAFTVMMFVISVAALIYQSQFAPITFDSPELHRFIRIGIAIGPVVSAVYIGLLILLLQIPLLKKGLSPLKSYGRMALTNYLLQSVLILLAGKLVHDLSYLQSLYICLAILVTQLLFSKMWLHYFAYGPFEWIWRMATYGERLPIRRKGY